jgi:alpha-glucosidase
MAFTLGKALLIAPPPKPESPQQYDICLPSGGWYDLWTGMPVTKAAAGGAAFDTIKETPKLDRLPVYVRAGTILPRQPLVQSTSETPSGPLTLDVYPGPDCTGTLYADDGHSMAFERGAYLRQSIRCEVSDTGLRIAFAKGEGTYRPWWRDVAVTVHGMSAEASISVRGKIVAARHDGAAQTLGFTLPYTPGTSEIVIGGVK